MTFAARSQLHLPRKIWHVGGGGLVLLIYILAPWSQKSWAILGVSLGVVGMIFDLVRLRFGTLNTRVMKSPLRLIYRASEEKGISGFPWYALGAGAALWIYPPDVAVLAIMFLVFCDPFCSLIGILYGEHRISENKSLEGSFAFFLLAQVLCLVMVHNSSASPERIAGFVVATSLGGALSELVSDLGVDDNLTIPLLSGGVIWVADLMFRVM